MYDRGQSVAADYSCADEAGGSGLKSCVGTVPDGDAIDTASAGVKRFTVTAEDNDGNRETVTHSYRVMDRTKPAISLTTPANGASYAQGANVAADYSCSDEAGGSGLKSCQGTVADGALVDTATPGPKSFTVTAEDNDGNTHSVTHNYTVTVADGQAPSIDIRSPRDGATYKLGENVVVDYSCSDGGSGVASCTGDLPDGARLDTSRAGARSFTVRSTDRSGNSSSRTIGYRVGGFDFEGFYGLKRFPALNNWKAGAIVPIMFSLEGYHGRSPIATGYPRSGAIRCGSSEQLDASETTRSRGEGRLRYKPGRDLYVYLWDTDSRWAGSCRQFVLKLDDGSVHRANFRFTGKKRPHHDDDD